MNDKMMNIDVHVGNGKVVFKHKEEDIVRVFITSLIRPGCEYVAALGRPNTGPHQQILEKNVQTAAWKRMSSLGNLSLEES